MWCRTDKRVMYDGAWTVGCVRRAWCMTASKVWCEGSRGALTSSARSAASRSASAEPGSACSARRKSSTCQITPATTTALDHRVVGRSELTAGHTSNGDGFTHDLSNHPLYLGWYIPNYRKSTTCQIRPTKATALLLP